MGTIHFVSGLESLTLKALKDAEDCADILKDLATKISRSVNLDKAFFNAS